MRAAVAFVCILLVACADDGERRDPAARDTSTPLTAGEERARIGASNRSATTLRSGPNVPVNLPAGLTLYPGARILSNTVVERGGVTRVLAVIETTEPIAEVMAFYRAQARNAGLAIAVDLGGDARASLAGTLGRGTQIAISARRTGDATRIELASVAE